MKLKNVFAVGILCLASGLGYNYFLSNDSEPTYSNNYNKLPTADIFYSSPVVETNCMQRHCCPTRASAIINKTRVYSSNITIEEPVINFNNYYTPTVFIMGDDIILVPAFIDFENVTCCIGTGGSPIHNNPPAVPEPKIWAIMLLGFGIVGFKIRKSTHKGVLINEYNFKYRQL